MPRKKGSKNKTPQQLMQDTITSLMRENSATARASAVRLQMAYDKMYGSRKKTNVDPSVLGFYELIMKLEQELEVSGEKIIAALHEKIGDVEQLARREMPSVRGTDGDDSV